MHFGSRGPSEVLSVRLGYVTEMHWRRRPGKTPYKDKTNVYLVWLGSLFFRWIRHIFSVQKPLSLSCLIQLVWKKNYYRKRTSSLISRKIWNWRYYGLRGRNNQNLFHLGNLFCDTPIKMRQMCVSNLSHAASDWYKLSERLVFLPYISSSILLIYVYGPGVRLTGFFASTFLVPSNVC